MDQQVQLNDINAWRDSLGLLPVPLFDDRAVEQPAVLLNGAVGNFCLDFGHYELGQETRDFAWSANVGHYIAVRKDRVEVQRWDREQATIERYSRASIVGKLEQFHAHLERHAPRQERSIVAHAIHIFRSLRALTEDGRGGADSLKTFLYLLACATAKEGREQIVSEDWGLDRDAAGQAALIRDGDWEALREDLSRGRATEHLAPRLDLLLRHASGQLFQEAHYEATFMPRGQLRMEGFLPLPAQVRQRAVGVGVHFTPQALARTLVEETLRTLDPQRPCLTILDPACGSGEFLREALRQLKLRRDGRPVHLIGWDVSEAACDMARFALAWERRGMAADVTIDIQAADSLDEDHAWPVDVDVVLMNPPFLSWEAMTELRRDRVTHLLRKSAGARPDLSLAFIALAANCLAEGGVLGTIAPASFLDSNSAAALRADLGDRLTPRLIARLGSQLLFSGALVDAAFYVASKGLERGVEPIAFWADPRSGSSAAGLRRLRRMRYVDGALPEVIDEERFSIYPHAQIGRGSGSWAPRPYGALRLMDQLASSPRVRDLFDVRQGIRTGARDVSLLDQGRWEDLPASEREYFRAAVINASIENGTLRRLAYVFYPYGQGAPQTEDQLQDRLPTYYGRDLLPHKADLIARAISNPARWWELTRGRPWLEKPVPKLVSSYFGAAGDFAYDDTGEYAVVQGLAWLPKRAVDPPDMLRKIQFAYLAVLNSSLFSELLAATSNPVSGGQWNLSRKFVMDLPLPDLFVRHDKETALDDLAALGAAIHAGLGIDDARIRDLVGVLYRLQRSL